MSDKSTFENKGLTFMTENERLESVRHCRYVDEAFIRDSPWGITVDYCKEHKVGAILQEHLY